MSRPSNGYMGGARQPSENSSVAPSVPSQTSNMSRAQRFENEKMRLQESCFSKVDENGQQAESYITHLRIEEDGAYPSAPPPPESPADNKKPRVIAVAVRSTGRVRVHKARENHNGSFSVGKTWNLEDLSAIESFNYLDPNADPQRRLNVQRAGPLGFVVTITKPYYWQAGTAKERDFFIASLVKIYRKYTKGRTPNLIGFSDAEREQMFGPITGQQPPPQRAIENRGTPPAPQAPFFQQSRPSSRDARDPRSRVVSNERINTSRDPSGSPAPPPGALRYNSQDSHLPQVSTNGQQSMPPPDNFRRPPEQMGLGIRNHKSREDLRNPSTERLSDQGMRQQSGRLSPQPSKDDAVRQRGESPAPSTHSASSRGAAPVQPSHSPQLSRSNLNQQQEDSRANGASTGASLFHSTKDRWMPVAPAQETYSPKAQAPSGEFGHSQSPELRSGQIPGEMGRPGFDPKPIPERKRPPIAQQFSYEEDLKPPPLSTSRSASGQRPVTPRTEATATPSIPGAFYETPQASTSNLATAQPLTQRETSPAKKAEDRTQDVSKDSPALSHTMSPVIGATSEAGTPDTEKDEDEAHKPGLGPMIKKRIVADKFRKAASAAVAFKPRAGGAGERLKRQQSITGLEPDGISGVVPAPLRTMSSDAGKPEGSTTPASEAVPTVNVQSPTSPAAGNLPMNGVQLHDKAMSPNVGYEQANGAEGDSKAASTIEQRKPKRRSQFQERYLASLGIDPAILEGKGLDFETTLTDFGWGSSILQPKHLENLENDMKREIGRVEAGSWLGHMDTKDDRVDMVDKMLDRAIAECEELDGLLTLYSVELSTLNDDIAFIEAQSQGLQVQTANQKILHTELHNLVDMISLTHDQLEPIERGSFDEEMEDIEAALVLLYNAMLTIDPSIKSTDTGNADDEMLKAELARMSALQEKRDIYLGESSLFCQRLISRLSKVFDAYINESIPSLMKPPAGKTAAWNLHPQACNAARTYLWQYSPLILFTKEVDQSAWRRLLEIYMGDARPCYAAVFCTASDSHRKTVRAATGDEEDVLFTSAEKEISEGLTSTTRKLTMKRSQTLAKAVRSASGEKAKMLQSGRQMPCEAFSDMLGEWAPILIMEQNFVVELFHATTLENIDFAEAVATMPMEQRRGPPDLMVPKIMEPDRSLAEYVSRAMGYIFDFWPHELKKTIEQSISTDPLQGIGIMASIAVQSALLHETSQEFLLRTLTESAARLQNLFTKFIDDQIRAIEDTKVKIKKRKGVIAFMRIFPNFSISVENIYAGATRGAPATPDLMEVRSMIDAAYDRINQAMWVSLKQIARESPTMGTQQGAGADPEDKEVLNYHILLIENMNHYIEEVDDGGKEDAVLTRWKGKALMERAEHLDEYVKRVVRRPLGKVLDFLESTESLLNNGTPPASVASKPSHSRTAARKALSTTDGREIRKGIDALRKRIEKHFGDADDEALSQKLVVFVCGEAEREYGRVLDRLNRVVGEVYSSGEERGVEVEWGVEDVRAGFRR